MAAARPRRPRTTPRPARTPTPAPRVPMRMPPSAGPGEPERDRPHELVERVGLREAPAGQDVRDERVEGRREERGAGAVERDERDDCHSFSAPVERQQRHHPTATARTGRRRSSPGAGRSGREPRRRPAAGRSSARSSRCHQRQRGRARSRARRPARRAPPGTRRRRSARRHARPQRRKSRSRSGASRLMRLRPPDRSSASWLCCIGRRALRRRVAGARRAASASIGRAKKKPWPSSQPRSRSAVICSGCSMPSATTCRSRVSPSATIARGQAGCLGRRAVAQERAVHLEDVDREAAEVAERRVAGAEVVDRERTPSALSSCEALARRRRCRPSARSR